jgi:hypothetical protein
MCAHLLNRDDAEANRVVFVRHMISFDQLSIRPSLVFEPDLVFRFGNMLVPSRLALPSLLSHMSFGRPLAVNGSSLSSDMTSFMLTHPDATRRRHADDDRREPSPIYDNKEPTFMKLDAHSWSTPPSSSSSRQKRANAKQQSINNEYEGDMSGMGATMWSVTTSSAIMQAPSPSMSSMSSTSIGVISSPVTTPVIAPMNGNNHVGNTSTIVNVALPPSLLPSTPAVTTTTTIITSKDGTSTTSATTTVSTASSGGGDKWSIRSLFGGRSKSKSPAPIKTDKVTTSTITSSNSVVHGGVPITTLAGASVSGSSSPGSSSPEPDSAYLYPTSVFSFVPLNYLPIN